MRIQDDSGSGFRGNPADFGSNGSPVQRGGFGSEPPLLGSSPQGPHSAAGFRRALMKTQSRGNKLKDQLPDKISFGSKGFKKPNYFAQGGQRHGMHVGSGAPFTGAAQQEGADFGG